MLTIVVIAAVVAGLFFVVKRPLRLDSSVRAAGQPLVCPACGSFFASPGSEGDIVRCGDCGAYARVAPGRVLAAIAPDFVDATHAFLTYLPEAPRWPACCCVCGAAPTRSEPLTFTYLGEPTREERLTAQVVVGVASLGTMRVAEHHVSVTERYKVPHCDQHAGGAKVVPAGVAFRSYGYYQKFVHLNRAPVGG